MCKLEKLEKHNNCKFLVPLCKNLTTCSFRNNKNKNESNGVNFVTHFASNYDPIQLVDDFFVETKCRLEQLSRMIDLSALPPYLNVLPNDDVEFVQPGIFT